MNTSLRPSVGLPQKSPKNTQTRSAKLRQMLQSAELEFLMEAHNGLSARIVREAIWRVPWLAARGIVPARAPAGKVEAKP